VTRNQISRSFAPLGLAPDYQTLTHGSRHGLQIFCRSAAEPSEGAKQQMIDHEFKNAASERLRASRRVVIKLGTSIVTRADGQICTAQVQPIARSIAAHKSAGRQVVLVSSGAVGLGAGRLSLPRARLNDLVVRQACAAVGQNLLMNAYERLFSALDVKIAQVLLTERDFADRRSYQNLRGTMEKLLKLGVLPIVNENDTVSTAELEYLGDSAERIFSDNDRLAALLMSKLEGDALILLTDVDGLLSRKTKSASSAGALNERLEAIPLVEKITAELRAAAAGPSASGRGGMLSKIDAAQIAMRAGGVAVIANGTKPDTLDRIFAGAGVGTTFISSSRMRGKRRWIAYAANVRGRVVVNTGARDAILDGKGSLLASGVIRVERDFDSLDVISIAGPEGHEFARGMANCASENAIVAINGGERSKDREESSHRNGVLVTRDNIVILRDLPHGTGSRLNDE
jgi:glutamate 5-kinase